MINNYFYHITISDGRLYCYNFKRKKIIANPCLHLPMPLQSATVIESPRQLCKLMDWWFRDWRFKQWKPYYFQFFPLKSGRFYTPYCSGRLLEPIYLANMLDDLSYTVNTINGPHTIPIVSSFPLSNVEWKDKKDRETILEWYNLYLLSKKVGRRRKAYYLSCCKYSYDFIEYLKHWSP
jgi:hypothetical protein